MYRKQKNNRQNQWNQKRFFGQINKIDKPLTRLVSIMNDRGDNTTDSTDNRRITREYYEQLYTYTFYNRDEIDKFFKRYTLPNFTQEESDNLNIPVSVKEIESVIKIFPPKSLQVQLTLQVNSKYFRNKLYKFYTTFRKLLLTL